MYLRSLCTMLFIYTLYFSITQTVFILISSKTLTNKIIFICKHLGSLIIPSKPTILRPLFICTTNIFRWRERGRETLKVKYLIIQPQAHTIREDKRGLEHHIDINGEKIQFQFNNKNKPKNVNPI